MNYGNYNDFTCRSYVRLLELAQRYYTFRLFSDFDRSERFILWRHDVDMSPQRALRLARIEQEAGVRSTHFLMLHSEFYNLLESRSADIVHEIIDLGHEIGLHYDCAWDGGRRSVDEGVRQEAEILKRLFGVDIQVFSFHNPTHTIINSHGGLRYGGCINTYADYFRRNVGYCSDSNGYWRHRRLEDVLLEAKEDRLQVLTHPVWWQEEPMPPRQRIQRCIDGRSVYVGWHYDRTLEQAGRKNVRE